MKPKKVLIFFYGPLSKKWFFFRECKTDEGAAYVMAKQLHPALTASPPYKIQVRRIYK